MGAVGGDDGSTCQPMTREVARAAANHSQAGTRVGARRDRLMICFFSPTLPQ